MYADYLNLVTYAYVCCRQIIHGLNVFSLYLYGMFRNDFQCFLAEPKIRLYIEIGQCVNTFQLLPLQIKYSLIVKLFAGDD